MLRARRWPTEFYSLICLPEAMNKPTGTIEFFADSDFVVGRGKAMESLNATVVEIARTGIPVLILGESGTGKEVYAQLLHRLSGCGDAPLKRLNCSTLDPIHMLQQMHDGSYKDSMTHQAATLFLDAIDELDLACQRALLSALPDSQVQRRTFMRLISSSTRNLEG